MNEKKTIIFLLAVIVLFSVGLVLLRFAGVGRKSEVRGSEQFNVEANMVIDYFEKTGDTMKVLAAKFIIQNAAHHVHIRNAFVDTLGNEKEFNVYDYETTVNIDRVIDSLKSTNRYQVITYAIRDVDMLRSDEIIENVELAFSAWKSKPWASHVTFDQFCELILPYRAYQESLGDWRSLMKNTYQWLEDSVHNADDPVEACAVLNRDLAGWLKFDWPRGSSELNLQSVEEIMRNKHGKCSDLVMIAACAMRSQGIPVAIDFVPHWAHRNSGHSWNVVLSSDGRMITFAGAEQNPNDHSVIFPLTKAGKVFRYMFGRQPESLSAQKASDDLVPPFFQRPNVKDVTAEYITTGDIELSGLKVSDGTKFVYLCTYSSGQWLPIHWSRITDGQATFTDMDDNNVVYLPAYFERGQMMPAGMPFLYGRNHVIQTFLPSDVTQEVSLQYYNQFFAETWLTGKFHSGIQYSLSYWDGYWRRIGIQTADDDRPVLFSGVPAGALLRIESVALSNIYQRPFSVSDGNQLFY